MCGIAKQDRDFLIRVWECVGVYVLVFHEAQDLWLFCSFLITTAVTSSEQIELATMTSYHVIWQIFIKKLYFLYFYGYNNIILCQAQKNPFKIDVARFLYAIKQQWVLTFSVALDPEVFFFHLKKLYNVKKCHLRLFVGLVVWCVCLGVFWSACMCMYEDWLARGHVLMLRKLCLCVGFIYSRRTVPLTWP